MNDNTKFKIINLGSEIGHGIMNGRRTIIHFDAFVIKTMKIIYDSINL